MQCRTCGTQLAPSANVCPNCGTPVSYSNDTIAASTTQGSQLPPTVYSGDSAPPPPPPNMSNSGNQYPSYGPPINSPYDQANVGPYRDTAAANYPSTPNYVPPNNYAQNTPYQNPNQYMPGPGPFQQVPRKKRSVGLIVGLVLLGVVVLCVCSIFAASVFNPPKPQVTTITTTTTVPTATPTSVSSPSGNPINAEAAQIITDPKLTAQVDKTTYAPVPGTETTQFKVKQAFYVTFTVHSDKYDVSQAPAYILVRFYAGTESVLKDDPLVVDKGNPIDAAYYGVHFNIPTDNGAAEVYWCRKADCSDKELAQVVHFTVS